MVYPFLTLYLYYILIRKKCQEVLDFSSSFYEFSVFIYLYEELKGKTVVQLKEILQTLTEEEAKHKLETETL